MRLKKLKFAVMLLFLLGLAIPSIVHAIPMTFTGVSPKRVVSTTHDGNSQYVYAGIYNQLVGDEQAQHDSFCIEFTQWAPGRYIQNDYEYKNLSELFVDPKVDAISKLWSNYYDKDMSGNNAAALQIAIWEVTLDDTYNIRNGNFIVSGEDYGAQGMLSNLGNLTIQDSFSLVALTNDRYQDYLVSGAPVPEPSTMLLLGTGLAGTALYRRRKNKRS